jgi:hypothetical protein
MRIDTGEQMVDLQPEQKMEFPNIGVEIEHHVAEPGEQPEGTYLKVRKLDA